MPGGVTDFVNDQTSPFKALVGGQGSSKTHHSVINTLITGSANAPYGYLYVEPTNELIHKVALPMFRKILDDLEVNHVWHHTRKELMIGQGATRFPVWFKSGEDPQSITGFEVAAFCIDEAARQKRGVFGACVQRMRSPGRRKQGSMTSTPEGFNWFYQTVQARPPEGMRLYRARTEDNPHLPPSYVRNMRATMTAAEYEAYAEGKFVNLTTGLVYSSFSRQVHDKRCANPFAGELVVGCDFNVSKMHWVIGRRLLDEIHIFAEVVGTNTNTYRQRDALMTRLLDMRSAARLGPWDPEKFIRSTRVHTDASGGARKTSATESDIAILRRGGFFVVEAEANPPIKDRVYTLEQLFRARPARIFVDMTACPHLALSLEGQGWGSDGLPEKGKGADDLSGGVDAAGYLTWGYPDLRSTHPGNRASLVQPYG